MHIILTVLKVILIAAAIFFGITFPVYFFNLEMKLLALIEPLIVRHYDKIKRNTHL